VDAGIARRHEGTGLGLPLAQRLTELHGGSLRIASERGRGTRMVVELPASRVLSERVAPTVAGLSRAVAHRPIIAVG
jgi:nitrogen-specific signal transduction histidine kinase